MEGNDTGSMAAETGTKETGCMLTDRVVIKTEVIDEEITIKEEFSSSDINSGDARQTAQPGLHTSPCMLDPENVKTEPLNLESAGLNNVNEVSMHTSHAVEDIESRPDCMQPNINKNARIGKGIIPDIVVEIQVDDPRVNDPGLLVEVKLEPAGEDEARGARGGEVRGDGGAGADTAVCVDTAKTAKRKAKKKAASDPPTSDLPTSDTPTSQRIRSKGPHICQTCNKEFKKSNKLVIHMRTHTGERPYTCNFCNKNFSYPNGLKVHLRTHTGEKPHVCTFCDKRFRQWNTLKAHERLHTGEKPYVCEICKRGFTQNNLKQHMLVHTELKQHSCPVCQKEFKDVNSLRRHEPLHKDDKPYSCATCSKKFAAAHHLRYHETAHARMRTKALEKRKKK